jgi:hypothetical protein
VCESCWKVCTLTFGTGVLHLNFITPIFVEFIYITCSVWRVAVRPSYIKDARFLKVNMSMAETKGSSDEYV